MAVTNPFTASFGVDPPLLVGRDGLLSEFAEALDDGPGATGRATLYTGARGTGKTVMLNAVEELARSRGWLVVSETASAGFAARITGQHLPRLLRDFDPDAVARRLRGITGPMGVGAIAWETIERHAVQAGLRTQLELLTELVRGHGTGVLITLDEIHHDRIAELREVAVALQHAFREGRQVAFAGAGLASSVSDVVRDEVLTFLRRADRYHLGPVPRADVERGLRIPIEASGRTVGDEALAVMVDGTGGYPFLLQLIGAQTWRLHPDEPEVTAADARAGVARAQRKLGTLVHEPALADTTEVGRTFLRAMAVDDGPARMADIRDRLGVDDNYASQYRLRLIAAELIAPVRRGYVDFTLPYLREYLREHSGEEWRREP